MKFQAPKGTRDFYPAAMAVENYVFDKWRTTARLFGFEEYEGPIFEHLELFTAKSGDEIVHQLYNFKDKAQRDLALRPELTPGLARMVNASGTSLRYPLRWFSIPRCFRYERMQKGRLREFFQLNLDIIGTPSPAADAELLAAIAHMLRSFGLTDEDFCIRVSSRKLLQGAFQSIGIDPVTYGRVLSVLDRQEKVDAQEYSRLLAGTGISAAQIASVSAVQSVGSLQEFSRIFPAMEKQGLGELEMLFQAADAYGINTVCQFDPKIVRGLAYYTGIVFEVFFKGEKMRAIAGGGRYDHLLESLGGRPCPATGFGIGDVVLADILRQKNLLPEYQRDIDCYIVAIGNNAKTHVQRLAALLRSRNKSAVFSFETENPGKPLKRAAESNARFALILGDDEIEKGLVRMKNLSTGDQKAVKEAEIEKEIMNS